MERERERNIIQFCVLEIIFISPENGARKKKGKRGRGNKRMEGNTDQSEYRPDDDGQSRM